MSSWCNSNYHLIPGLKRTQQRECTASIQCGADIIRSILSRILTSTTRTPAFWGYPPPPHDYPFYWVILDPKSKEDKVKFTNSKNSPKFQIFEIWNKHYTEHTFWSSLIRCANMIWVWLVMLKIQSRHGSVHRRTDRRTDKRTRWNQYTPLSTSLKLGV